ncbi:MAG: HU family DNA-binding protein [Paludibacter sp.]|jgi:DNA-binding protein HU-beta|nr:HU family DNA-binding protein [Paludibacter sp.]
MNHSDLISKISEKAGLTAAEIENLLVATSQVFTEQLLDDKIIGIQNFGNFELRLKEERLSVHPTTKVRTLVPPKRVVNFKQSNNLKDKLKGVLQ